MIQPLPSNFQKGVRPRPTRKVVSADRAAVHAIINELLERSGMVQDEAGRRMGCTNGARISQIKGGYKIRNGTGPARPSFEWVCKLIAVCGAQLWIEFPAEPFAD